MQKYCPILIFLIFLTCSRSNSIKKDELRYNNENPIISLRTTAGYGKNPVYEITIRGDGQVRYMGRRNVKKIGAFKLELSVQEIDDLVTAFKIAGFENLNDEYSARITDLPTTFISFKYNGKFKQIKDYYGAPAVLKDLEHKITSLIDREEWIKIE